MNPLEFATLAHAERDLWWFRGMHDIALRLLEPIAAAGKVSRVLDAGCGTGYFAGLAEQRYGWSVFPTDLSWEGLRRGRAAGARRLVRADITSLPYPSEWFDLVMSLDVLVHFRRGEESRALAEFRRVLAPGGRLLIRVSALDILRSRHSEFAGERQRFTRSLLVCAVEAQGFRVLRCTYANSLLLPVALGRFRIWEPLTRQQPKSGTAPVPGWLNNLLLAPLKAEAGWIGAGRNFPLGQSLLLVGAKK
jgi:SAM-dependent methyltransferase